MFSVVFCSGGLREGRRPAPHAPRGPVSGSRVRWFRGVGFGV